MSKSTFVTLIMELREGNLFQTCHCLIQGWGLIFLFQIKSIPFQYNKLLFCELTLCRNQSVHKQDYIKIIKDMKQNQLSHFWSNSCVLNPKKKKPTTEQPIKMCNKPIKNWENELKMLMQHKTYKEIIVATTACIWFSLFLTYWVPNTSINSQIVDFTFLC